MAMKIGDLADAAGVSVRALRYYEEQGLLAPDRTAGGQRVYGEVDVDKVRLVQCLYKAGLNSEAVRAIMPCVHTGVITGDMRERLVEERERVADQARALAETLARLDAVIGDAETRLQAPAIA